MRQASARLSYYDLKPARDSFLEEVAAGLARPQKEISPKYFYDQRGCELFEAICATPEYYPTRVETAIMQSHVREMARHLGAGCVVVEYGSGTSRKTRILIGELHPLAYIPIDIAGEQLRLAAAELAAAFPELIVIAVCADYSRRFALPGLAALEGSRRVIYFPGSTIGNFTAPEARRFLEHAAALARAGGGMLVGVDLKKEHALLDSAYNDARGVTAAFNLNLLARINRELGANFDLAGFRHRAFYNARLGRIEMHLVSVRPQRVALGGRLFSFRDGETIHTENSYKYSVAEFRKLAREAGFEPVACWTDPQRLFSVHYLSVAA
ncbi:MAG: L-histidine N(alpha)-methyltransferase [Betaproteobacteria bacterium]|nr:L-histidine N(alpha)-methyltransferase [Betaproteobacteria bacterium]